MAEDKDPVLCRALTTLYHDNRMYKAGDEFPYAGAPLSGNPAVDGMEIVNAKNTKAAKTAVAKATQELIDRADSLRNYAEELKVRFASNPTEVGLAQRLADAEIAADDAAKELPNDLV